MLPKKQASQRLRAAMIAARSAGLRQYDISHSAGIHPTITSALLTGALRVYDGDPRLLKLGEVLGVAPAECFE